MSRFKALAHVVRALFQVADSRHLLVTRQAGKKSRDNLMQFSGGAMGSCPSNLETVSPPGGKSSKKEGDG